MWTEFHFLRPYWFVALLPIMLLLWWLAKRHLLSRHWESVCDPALLPYVLVGKTGSRHYTSVVLTGLVALTLVIALAGPTWQRLPQPVFQKESALVIALDLSLSMLADDIKPSRLEHARFKISDLLDMRKEGQTALLVYAGDTFTVTPLTDDIKTIKSQLSALSPEIMPAPGSNTAIAISHAVELLKQGGVSKGDILLVTDEVDNKYEDSFVQANKEGYRLSVLGIGTKEGSPVRINGGSFLKDPNGAIVIPKLDELALRQFASIGGGRYENSRIDDVDINRLNSLFTSGFDTNEETKTRFETDNWYEFGPWLVLLVIPIIAFGFRRGFLSIIICLLMVKPDNSMAFEWNDLWLNKNQRAMRALNSEEANVAAELFQNKAWKAAAKYRAGDYAATEELLKGTNDERGIYNKANSLAKQGRYEEAIAAYDQVLEKNPNNEDAKYNRDLVKKELEKQKEQQSQSDKQNQENRQNQKQQPDSQQADNQQEKQQSEQEQQDSQEQQSGSDSQKQAEQNKQDRQEQKPGENAGQQQSEMNEQEEKQKQQQIDQSKNEEAEKKEGQQLNQENMNELDEEQQASEQWLRRIPDDPSGLLRRKFKYQYQQRRNQQATDEKYW